MLYVLMAALPATADSRLVLATSGGSPGWLLGPLRFAGIDAASGALTGPLYYTALWVALLLYVAVLRGVRTLSVRLVVGAIAAMHAIFLLAPPLLSHDVFSYIAYARLGAAHGLNPYTHAPIDIAGDPGFVHSGSVTAVSAYGPLFTLLTYPLSPLGVPAALWILKVAAALSSLGIVALVWRIAQRLGRDPLFAAAAVGLNPLVLVHVVGGAHNEALTLLVTMAGVLLWLTAPAGGAAAAGVAAGVKASAGIVVPFLVVGEPAERQAGRPRLDVTRVWALVGAFCAVAVIGLIGFGTHALNALSLIGSNQDRTSRYSIPYKLSELFGGLLPGDRADYRVAVRVVLALAFVAVFLWLLWRTWKGTIDTLEAIGWTTFTLLIASAWLVPWYILWLLPFAALGRDRRLHLATLALCAWMLEISVPL